MKKLLLFVVLLLALLVAAIYIFIPARLHISASTVINVSKNGTERILSDDKQWGKILGNIGNSGGKLVFNSDTLQITAHLYNAFKITINSKETLLHFINIRQDSTLFQWDTDLATGNNPISKVITYNNALKLKAAMANILQQLNYFLENKKNVYGLAIERVSTVDTLLVFTKKAFINKPNTAAIFALINTVEQFIITKGGVKSGHPIYHISKTDSTHYELMVAMPTNKVIANEANFSFKRMIKGSFMMTETIGGEYSVEAAQERIHQ